MTSAKHFDLLCCAMTICFDGPVVHVQRVLPGTGLILDRSQSLVFTVAVLL